MRCRDVEALWDELRGECQASLKETVHTICAPVHPVKYMYEQYEGVAYCLSCLPRPEPSCDLAKKVVQHIAALKGKAHSPIVLSAVTTPLGRLYVGFKQHRIAYFSLDTGRAARRRRRAGRAPAAARRRSGGGAALARSALSSNFFSTWTVDDAIVDISDLTPFEQAVLRAAARIPPRRGSLVRVGRDADRAAARGARSWARHGAQPVAAALSVPSRRGFVRRSARLLLRPRNESSASRNGGLPALDANLSHS